jgi:hypothetical protein
MNTKNESIYATLWWLRGWILVHAICTCVLYFSLWSLYRHCMNVNRCMCVYIYIYTYMMMVILFIFFMIFFISWLSMNSWLYCLQGLREVETRLFVCLCFLYARGSAPRRAVGRALLTHLTSDWTRRRLTGKK